MPPPRGRGYNNGAAVAEVVKALDFRPVDLGLNPPRPVWVIGDFGNGMSLNYYLLITLVQRQVHFTSGHV